MKTIGLLGGMSWESTEAYYRAINQGVKSALGGLHSAQIVLYSVDFQAIETMQHQDDWQGTASILSQAARSIETAGADFLVICTNTMHKVADTIERNIKIPLLHIADATGEALIEQKFSKVGLLGTAFTMEQTFYKQRLEENYNLNVIIPDAQQRKRVHQVIYEELCLGNINSRSRQDYIEIIEDLKHRGAQAVILGCTEIGLLIKPEDTDVPLFDTALIHAQKAVQQALAIEA